MINKAVKEDLNQKIQEGTFTVSDIPAYLALFCEMGNEIEDLQDEVEDWDRRILLVLDGLGTHWLNIAGGHLTTGAGALEDPELVLTMDAQEAALVFSGEKDAAAAFMSGALKVEGELSDALKMQALIGMVLDEIEYE